MHGLFIRDHLKAYKVKVLTIEKITSFNPTHVNIATACADLIRSVFAQETAGIGIVAAQFISWLWA